MTLRRALGLLVISVTLPSLVSLAPVGATGTSTLPDGCKRLKVRPAPMTHRLAVQEVIDCKIESQLTGPMVAGPEGLWAATFDGSESGIVRVDQSTLAITARIPLPDPQAMALRDDGLWVLSMRLQVDTDLLDLSQVDRETGEILRTVRLPISAPHSSDDQPFLTSTRERLWVALSNVRSLAAIDPERIAVVQTIPLPGRTEALAANSSTVWLESWSDDSRGRSSILAIAASTGEIQAEIPCRCGGIGRSMKLLATENDVWASGSRLVRIDVDARSLTDRRNELTGGLTSDGRDLWVLGLVEIPSGDFTTTNDDEPAGRVSRIKSGTLRQAAATVVTSLERRGNFLEQLTTFDGQHFFAMRRRYRPGEEQPRSTLVRMTIA